MLVIVEGLQAPALCGVEDVILLVAQSVSNQVRLDLLVRGGGLCREDLAQPDAEDFGGGGREFQVRPPHAVGARQAVKRPLVHRQPKARGDPLLQIAYAQISIVQQLA